MTQTLTPAVGLELVNPKARTATRFVATAESTDGAYVEVVATYPPNSSRPPLHLHPQQTEHFTLLSGSMNTLVDGKTSTLQPGDELVVPPGTPHQMWAGPDGAQLRWRTSPALRTGEMFCATWQTARDNDWSPAGLQLLEVISRHGAEFQLC